MTRWARARVTHNKKALDATPWDDLKNGTAGTVETNKKQSSSDTFSLKNNQVKKKNKKKKDYLNEDVNGFMEYLKQNSQMLHNGQLIDSHQAEEEITTALKKDKRREQRRVKRQEIKKNIMGNFHMQNALFVGKWAISQGHVLIILKDFMLKEDLVGFADLWSTLKETVQKIKTQSDIP
ncbi:Zinc finger CCHC domain-containing protein 9, partial [Ophiophagus hannah]